ncbi:MAG TPA: EF-P lysine aminoacylase EpmA [Acidobacteriota bacterium]
MAASDDLIRIRQRARLLGALRAELDAGGFLEVETPALVGSPGVDRHIDAPSATVRSSTGSERRYLITSPEYHMKRLVAAGSGPIYQLGKVWRDGEAGELHRPEFTLLELYRPGSDHLALMTEVERLVREAARRLLPEPVVQRRGQICDLESGFARIRVRDAFRRWAGVDLARAGAEELGACAAGLGLAAPQRADRETLYHLLMGLAIEPQLGRLRGEFLYDYPADQCALAQVRPDPEFAVAERFELYVLGIELCNGFHELTDAVEQRRRIEAENAARVALGKEPYPVDEDFLAALPALPACAGMALGVDRLALLLFGWDTL